MTKAKRGRGRPRKNDFPLPPQPSYLPSGLSPMMQQAAGRSNAERELKKDVGPYIPFSLVLELNDSDEYGRPVLHESTQKKYEAAMDARKKDGQSGGANNREKKPNRARLLVAECKDYIENRLEMDWSKSGIFNELQKRSNQSGSGAHFPCRSEFYKALHDEKVSGDP